MATIGEEVSKTLVSTNVVDNTDVFDNTVKQNYPKGTKYKEGDSIYQNTGNDIFVTTYDAQGTYAVGDIVFKDSLVKRCDATTGEFPTQPEDYPSVDTDFDYTAWSNRYMKFADLPVGAKQNDNTLDLQSLSNPVDLAFSSTGLWLYILDNSANKIYQYSLSTAWDISTATYTNKSVTITETNAFGLSVSTDGSYIYYTNRPAYFDADIIRLTMTTAYQIDTAGSKQSISLQDGLQIEAYAIYFKADGTKLYVADGLNDRIHEYNLSTPWNVTTRTRVRYIAVSISKVGLAFSLDGTKMYIADTWDNRLHQYNLSTAWNISTAVYSGKYVYTGDGFVDGLAISPNGDAVYFIDRIYDTLNQFISYTPFEINTFQKTMFPVNLNRTVDFKNYKYSILKNGTTYSFQRTDIWNNNAISEFTPMSIFTSLDNYSVEESAYNNGVERGQWLAKTLILRDNAIYIRTSVNAPIIYITLTDYQFSVVTTPSDLSGFTRIGASNPYKAIDGSNISPAISSSPVNYVLQGGEELNSFTLAKVLADSITYTFKYEVGHSEYDLWLDGVAVTSGGNGIVKSDSRAIDCKRDSKGILSHYPTTIMLYAGEQMLVDTVNNKFPLVEIDVTRASGEIQIGDFTLNNAVDAGFTKLNFGHGVQDFNDYTPDAWGAIPEGVKAKVTKFTITTDIFLENYDYAVSFNESISGKFISIDGSDSNGEVSDSLTVFSSLTRRVMVKSITSNSVEKDGEMWRMANVKIAVQEVV